MLARLRRFLRAVFRQTLVDRELDEELRYHLEREAERLVREGWSPGAAGAEARRLFGGYQRATDTIRDARPAAIVSDAMQDLRYAARMLRRDPALAIVAVLTLALTVGGSTAIFSVVNGVLLRPLPIPDAGRLVVVTEQTVARPEMGVSFPDYRDWRARLSTFDELAASIVVGGVLTGDGDPERVFGRAVTATFFHTLQTPMHLGRGFTADEDRPGGARSMVLGHSLWTRRYGRDGSVVGRRVVYNDEPYVVIGVLPAGFDFYGRSNANNDFFVPLGLLETSAYMQDRGSHPVRVLGRLKAGVSIDAAGQEMAAVAASLAGEYPETNRGVGVRVRPLLDDYVGDTRLALSVLMAAALVVLIIACANVANLLLARASARRREMALRLALGAGRGRIVRQLLTEALLMSLIGGAAGLAIGWPAASAIDAWSAGALPRASEIALDWRVACFTAAISIAAGLAFGAFPALQFGRVDPRRFLGEGGWSSTAGGRRVREALVVAQIGLSIGLLAGAALLARSYASLVRVDPGFAPDGVVTMRVRLSDGRYRERAQVLPVLDRLLAGVAVLPGVASASLTTGVPLGRSNDEQYAVEGQPEAPPDRRPSALVQWVTADYHRTLGIGLSAGRYFDAREREKSADVAIVDEEFTRRAFPGEPASAALGRRVRLDGEGDRWREIVGVVRHVRHASLDEPALSEMYAPFEQMEPGWQLEIGRAMDVAIRTTGDPAAAVAGVRRVVQAIDPEVPLSHVRTLDAAIEASMAPRVLNIALLGWFALLALVLCAVGLYGVMSYAVTQRTREIGIRIALGAKRSEVTGLLLRRALIVVVIGSMVGVCAAALAGRLLRGLLYAVTPADPATLSTTVALIAAIAVTASYLPARRATRLDPLAALREE